MTNLKVYLMLLGFAIFTGMTFNFAQYSVDYFSPPSAAAWRFGIAAFTMLILLVVREGIHIENIKRNGLAFIILGLVGIFSFNALFFFGLKHTSAINGALIMGTNPIITSIIAKIFLKESITKRQLISVLIALIGIVLVITQGSLKTITNLSFSPGDFIILIANFCWAFYGVLGKKLVKDSSSLATTTYTMVFGALGLIILSIFSKNPVRISEVTMGAWGAIVFMALFTSVLGYLWWNEGMRKIGAVKTSLFFNLVPIVTTINSFAIGIQITLAQIIGVVLVILAVLTASGFNFIHIFHLQQKRRQHESIRVTK